MCVCVCVSVYACLALFMHANLCIHANVFLSLPHSRLHSLLPPLITEVAPHKAAGLLCLIESSCRFTV